MEYEKIVLPPRARVSFQPNGQYELLQEVEHFLDGKHYELVTHSKNIKKNSSGGGIVVFSPRTKEKEVPKHACIFYPKLRDFRSCNSKNLHEIDPKIKQVIETFNTNWKEVRYFSLTTFSNSFNIQLISL